MVSAVKYAECLEFSIPDLSSNHLKIEVLEDAIAENLLLTCLQ